jgi:hypothetical protein
MSVERMRLKAFSRIKRINGFFHAREAVIDCTFNSEKGQGPFKEFPFDKVKSEYSKKQPLDGEVFSLIFEKSQIDDDFFLPDTWQIWIISADELDELENFVQRMKELLTKTDDTTEKMLGRGWLGRRPNIKLHHFM